jgi:type I restriction enzyme S subunit
MMRFRIAAGIMPQFVQQYLGTVQGRRLMTVNAKWAVNQASINQQDVLATAIPIAPPDEQGVVIAEIERRFAVADRVEETVAQGIAQSQRLRQSILKRAFSGRLVPQDPKDEPADKLLERIGAAKGADADEGKTRRRRARV